MPQKKNPDPLELVRGKAGRVHRAPGRLAGDDEGAAERLQQGSAGGQGSGVRRRGHAARVARRLRGRRRRAHAERAPRAEAAASGLLLATDVADYLVAKGVPFRDAHEIVGAIVRKLVAEGRDFASLTLDEWRAFSDRFGPDVGEAITAKASVAAKRTPQSTQPRCRARGARRAGRLGRSQAPVAGRWTRPGRRCALNALALRRRAL